MIPNGGPADPPASVPAQAAESDKPQQSRAGSLTQFIEMKGARAAHVVSDLNKGLIKSDREDLASAAAMVGAKPDKLSKVLEFTKAALGRGGPAREIAMRLAMQSIQHQDETLKDWPMTESTAAELAKVVGWARIRIRAKTREMKTRGENVLSLGLLVLIEQRVLEPAVILRELSAIYGSAGDGAAGTSRNVVKLLQKARPAQLAQFAKIAEFQTAAVEDARRKVSEEQERVAEIKAQVIELQNAIGTANEALEESRREVAARMRDIDALRRELESAHRMGAHDIGDLRARYRRVFSEEFEPVVNDAADALELNRPDFAKDYVGNLRRRIAEEVQWLNSSSE